MHISNIAYSLFTRLATVFIFIFTVPFFITTTSVEEYGLVSMALSLLTIATVLDVAIGYVVVQSFGRKLARNGSVLNTPAINLLSFYLLAATCTAICGLCIIFLLQLPMHVRLTYAGVVAALPFLCVSGFIAAIYQARNQLKIIYLSRFGFELSKALALIVSAYILGDIGLIGPILFLASIFRCILDVYFLKKVNGIYLSICLPNKLFLKKYWRLAKYGISPLLSVMLTLPINIGDKILIAISLGKEAVAHYSIAFDINTKLYIFVYAVNAAMFSVVLKRHVNKVKIFAPIAVGLIAVSCLGIFYYLPLFIYTPEILNYWLGQDFSENIIPLVRVMTISSLMYLYGNVFENSLMAIGHAKKILVIYLIGSLVYWTCAIYSYWMKEIFGFMFSYLMLSTFLFLAFLFLYINQLKISRKIGLH